MGLFTVWAEAKYAFPFVERLHEINWDAKVREYVPRVLEVRDLESYYALLMEFAALLKDGHTAVNPPWGPFNPGFDAPPIEVQVIGDKFIIREWDANERILESTMLGGGILLVKLFNFENEGTGRKFESLIDSLKEGIEYSRRQSNCSHASEGRQRRLRTRSSGYLAWRQALGRLERTS